jgi:3-polyprenyl-4-hydroxybenzoate decarboxylase
MPPAISSPSISASWAGSAEGAALPRRDPLGFITAIIARRRGAFRGRLRAAHHSVDDFAQAIRAIGEPIHSRTADQISMAKLLSLLFEITALFDMKTRTELIMLQKTMVVVEGVARSARSASRHLDDRRAGGARVDRGPARPARQARGGRPRPRRILLVIGGGIAAYKSLDLIRRLQDRGAKVRAILTKAGGTQFVTPLSVGSLTGDKVFQELFSLTDENEMGHIELSRDADLLVVAPATADLMAKMANGHANDLASTALLATDKKVLFAPAMNVRMWLHPATQRNLATLRADGALWWVPTRVAWPAASSAPAACRRCRRSSPPSSS